MLTFNNIQWVICKRLYGNLIALFDSNVISISRLEFRTGFLAQSEFRTVGAGNFVRVISHLFPELGADEAGTDRTFYAEPDPEPGCIPSTGAGPVQNYPLFLSGDIIRTPRTKLHAS